LFLQGREDLMFLHPQWNVPVAGTFPKLSGWTKKKEVDNSKSAAEKINSEINMIVKSINKSGSGSSSGSSSSADLHASHEFNMGRLHEDICEQFGADEPGAPREWNEEMQSMRAVKCTDISDKVMKAKYIHKIYQEFADAVMTGTVAIMDGHIAAMNPRDEEKAQVFVRNNIFYSRAVDADGNFKACDGEEASRKLAGHDLKNQRLIQSLDIEGLCTVLSCVVDFKGERLIGQTIIPGVLQVGAHSARLLYGTLELGKRLSVKNEAMKVMTALFAKLLVVPRTILATPTINIYPGEEPKEKKSPPMGMGILGAIVEDDHQAPGVQIDTEDETEDPSSETVKHIGCLEMKVLKGTDNRSYVRDAMRLTPRDANYVVGPKGTGNIPAYALKCVDRNIAVTYVLRQELINSYAQHKASTLRQEIIQKEMQNHRNKIVKKESEEDEKLKILDTDSKEGVHGSLSAGDVAAGDSEALKAIGAVVAAPVVTAVEPDGKDAIWKSVVSQKGDEDDSCCNSDTEGDSLDLDDEKYGDGEKDSFGSDLNQMFLQITAESVAMSLQLNVNCFIDDFDCDTDPAVALKDEELARKLASFLYKQVTVSITEQVHHTPAVYRHTSVLYSSYTITYPCDLCSPKY
jgi:Clustered mitochondria